MARPTKSSIDYFPFYCNTFDSDDTIDLMDSYGPKGFTIYMVILTIVYQNGYYVEFDDINKFANKVLRRIGNRWSTRQFVCEVIDYCAELGLLDYDLLQQSVITSKSIQIQYELVVSHYRRTKNSNRKYWIVGDHFKNEDDEPLLNVPQNIVFSEKTMVSSEKTNVNSCNNSINKIKENYIYLVREVPDELKDGLADFLLFLNSKGKAVNEKSVDYYMDNLNTLSKSVPEQNRIIKRTLANGWFDFYPLQTVKATFKNQKNKKTVKNSFHNFEQGEDVDYDEIAPKVAVPLKKEG